MPLMYAQNTLQMEWCLDCHRNPTKYLRPSSETYNMAWESPSNDHPVWCAVGEEKSGLPTAQSVSCVTSEPGRTELALLEMPSMGAASGAAQGSIVLPKYEKFASQDALGNFLVKHYKIRTPKELTSCEVCHR
jgi:hypothetical protein